MIFETNPVLEMIATIIGGIINFIQPIVTPIGEVMVFWVNKLLPYFPFGDLTLYIAIFLILVIAGVIINASIIGRLLKEKVEEIEDKISGKNEEDDEIIKEKQDQLDSDEYLICFACGYDKNPPNAKKCKECNVELKENRNLDDNKKNK